MTSAALITMFVTWSIIAYFMAWSFMRVLRSPHLHNPQEDALEDQLKD